MYVNAAAISTQTFLTKIIIDLSLAVEPYTLMWGMRNCQWSHMGCPSQVDRTWPFLCCPACLTPPPRARRPERRLPGPPTQGPPNPRRIGPGIPGPPPTTRACDSGQAPSAAASSGDDIAIARRQQTVASNMATAPWMTWPPVWDVNEFEIWVDGSGGKVTWGVGLADVRDEKDIIYGGYKKYLGALRDGREDGNMAEVLGLYCGLSYARDRARRTTGAERIPEVTKSYDA